ncbi:MAG: TRAP transporter substrate-binding protein [Rhodospirillales bacterium]|jgi:TRAP-type C4-dicarboxylate transport system substrate-binding protein|nr:TRAP transporter substrate-binding protein [Rhodospirillales bacterium]|tara:strand:+ start:139 stop:1146 length:1008 start_codon:yes stop_codon:yes gene_type:complete
MRILSTALLSATALGLAFSPTKLVGAEKLIYNNFTPPTHPITLMAKRWSGEAAKASGGKLKFRFPAKSLAPPPRQWSMVTSGVADLSMLANIFETKRLTLTELATLPFGTSTAQKTSIALWKTYKKFFEGANEYKGVKLLGLFVHGGGDLNMVKKQIMQASDLKSLKIRVSRGMAAKEMKAVGAVLVPTPGVKTFEVVSKGIVDGAILPSSDIAKMKMIPYIKYIYTIPGKLYNTPFSIMMNQKRWDGLSKDIQNAILSKAGLNISHHAKAWDDGLTEAIPRFKKAGVNYVPASPKLVADFKAIFASFADDWIKSAAKKGIDGKSALAFYRKNAM